MRAFVRAVMLIATIAALLGAAGAPAEASPTPAAHAPVPKSSSAGAVVAPGSTERDRSGPPLPLVDASWSMLALGAFGVAAIAITGISWFGFGRRRGEDDEDQVLDAAGRPSVGRAVRRSRLEPSDDPILAAMNLPAHDDTAPRIRAGQVNIGPGERSIATRRGRPRS